LSGSGGEKSNVSGRERSCAWRRDLKKKNANARGSDRGSAANVESCVERISAFASAVTTHPVVSLAKTTRPSRVSISPRESRLLYEQAFDLFRAQAQPDLKGLILVCTGAMDAILYEIDDFSLLDRRIAHTVDLVREHPELLSSALEARVANDERRGVASAYGQRGTFARCEYQMSSPRMGAGTCTFSNGAEYQVHIGS
jgi:hypothetical protein